MSGEKQQGHRAERLHMRETEKEDPFKKREEM